MFFVESCLILVLNWRGAMSFTVLLRYLLMNECLKVVRFLITLFSAAEWVLNVVTRPVNVRGCCLPHVGQVSMQNPPPLAGSLAQQAFQAPPPMVGQPQMLPGPQSPHMSPQMSPPQSPQASMSMTGQPMAGMGRPFPGAPPPGLGGFQQPGPGVAGPQGYPQQSGSYGHWNRYGCGGSCSQADQFCLLNSS